MKIKVQNIIIPFILMMLSNIGVSSLIHTLNFGQTINPHMGVIFISGLFFGPVGALSASIANFISDIIRGYGVELSFISFIITLSVSYLPYKLWYIKFSNKEETTRPLLINTYNLLKMIGIILLSGFIYSSTHALIVYIVTPGIISKYSVFVGFFINFINFSFIFTVIGIWISKKIDFMEIPSSNEKSGNNPLVYIVLVLFFTALILFILIDSSNVLLNISEVILLEISLFIFIIKKYEIKVMPIKYKNSISENLISYFLLITFIILLLAYLSFLTYYDIENLISADIFLLTFFIPTIILIVTIDRKIVTPIVSFSEIKEYVKKDEKIESDSLIEIYSKYDDEDNEIGALARSYTNLIKYNNNYIENIQEIEGEKERIRTELDIATKIQSATLPTQAIEDEHIYVNGFSKSAKEVGGDFFDYYELDDENIVIVIGDASGKGIPAALIAMVTKEIIKQLVISQKDNPAKILYALNNQLCENNSESMFITLWLGIYNKTSKKIIYSNAGHNPPIIKEGNKFKLLNEETGLVIGIMEDFEFINEERILEEGIILYTDGITDANNKNYEMYGEDRLLEFFNKNTFDNQVIDKLLNDINVFVEDIQQYDDMTILILKSKI